MRSKSEQKTQAGVLFGVTLPVTSTGDSDSRGNGCIERKHTLDDRPCLFCRSWRFKVSEHQLTIVWYLLFSLNCGYSFHDYLLQEDFFIYIILNVKQNYGFKRVFLC